MHPLHQMRTTGSDWRLVHIRKFLETNIRFVRVICGQLNNNQYTMRTCYATALKRNKRY